MYSYSNEEIFSLKLVQEVEKYPVLYNFKLADYSKRDAVEQTWEKVAKTMNDTATNCKEKWRNIRTVLSRKLKPPPIGSRRCRRPYYLMDALQFIIPYIGHKLGETTSPVPSPPGSTDSTPYSAPYNASYSTPYLDEGVNNECTQKNPPEEIDKEPEDEPCKIPKKRKQLKRTFPVSAADAALIKYVESRRKESRMENPRRMFLLSLLPDVQKLSDTKMRIFRKRVLDVIDSLVDDDVPCSSVSSHP